MGTAEDLVVVVPLLVERPQHTERTHELTRQKHVVDDTLEVKPTTGIDNTSSNNTIITPHISLAKISSFFGNQDQKSSQNFILYH